MPSSMICGCKADIKACGIEVLFLGEPCHSPHFCISVAARMTAGGGGGGAGGCRVQLLDSLTLISVCLNVWVDGFNWFLEHLFVRRCY